jgi:transcription elongation factor GreA
MERFKITKEGFENLKAKIDNLKNTERPNIIKAIAEARELGDLKENAEYHSAKDKQGFIEAQLADLENKISRSEVIDVLKISSDKIEFGATVELEDLDSEKKVTYKIVSDFEADIDQGLISNISPVARAIIGKSEGDVVEIKTPGGTKEYDIINISYK